MNDRRFWKKRYIIPAAIVGAPVVIAIFVLVAGGVVMLLWNWLLPPLFGWSRITIWQGFGLLALCRILFGGFGKGGGGYPSGRMTKKERDRVTQRMRERMCRSGVPVTRPANEPATPTVSVRDDMAENSVPYTANPEE